MSDTTASYITVVGLEVHVQLLTRTKLFCGCANRFNPTQPNVQTCPVCLGLPGSLPVMNRRAFELALKTGLALNCQIPKLTKWDRKQYYYPDLPKGYQISQYDLPFSSNGWLEIATDPPQQPARRIGIIRAHLEEDAGKNFHDETGRGGESLVDLNRAGTPLLEIVTQPDIRSGAEAHAFLDELKLLLTYLEVSDCNMQEGSLRCDANVNLHVAADGGTVATPIVEVKNLNSFRGVELAIEYEAKRQLDIWKTSGKSFGEVAKETRGWDAERGVTFGQRGKEEAADYRYFPDPDLVPVTIEPAWREQIRAGLAECPAAKRQRFQSVHNLSHYDASVIVAQGRTFADKFEELATACDDWKLAANWMTQSVLRDIKEGKVKLEEINWELLKETLLAIKSHAITTHSAKTVYVAIMTGGIHVGGSARTSVNQFIDEQGLRGKSSDDELIPIIDAVLAANAKIVADVKGGKQQATGALIGQVMRQSKGADPQTVRKMLISRIERSEDNTADRSGDRTREFIAKMDASLLPMFLRCVVPIYAEQNGTPIPCGTGTLFRVAETSFLTTASHVADLMGVHQIPLYITDAPDGSHGIALEGKLHSERNVDVAVWELTSQVVAELPNRTFLTVHHADRSRSRLGKGWYYVHGYPNCWSEEKSEERKVGVRAFNYGTVLYDGPTDSLEGYDPEVHVLLSAPKQGNVDSHGAPSEMPKDLGGISGSSLWQAYYEGLSSRDWSIDDATIVAVQTGIYDKGSTVIVKGTCWWVINQILLKNYPDLHSALSIVTPHMRRTNR